MRATPPSLRMSAGTRSRAITATAPASSAMRAWSASVTSMMTPPLSISARPDLTLIVPVSAIAVILATALEQDASQSGDDAQLPPDRVGAGRLQLAKAPRLSFHAERHRLVEHELVGAPLAVQRERPRFGRPSVHDRDGLAG